MLEYEEHIRSLLDINKRLNEELMRWQDRYRELSTQKEQLASPRKEERLSFGISSTNMVSNKEPLFVLSDRDKRQMFSPKLGGSVTSLASGEAEGSDWKNKCHNAEHTVNLLNNKVRDYEFKLTQVTTELEKVNEALRIKLKEVDHLKRRSSTSSFSRKILIIKFIDKNKAIVRLKLYKY